MQKTMQSKAAVFRTQKTMDEGVTIMKGVMQSLNDVKVTDRSLIWNTDLVETLELDNLLSQAMVSISAASKRDDVNWMKHTLTWLNDSTVTFGYRPVHLYTLTDEVEVVMPKERVY